MTKLSIDIETFSEADLKTVGVHSYAEHPSTEVLCICYAFDDEPVQRWIPADVFIPDRLRQHIGSRGIVSAFNAEFERTVLNGTAGAKIGFPEITIEQTRCSMVKARSHGLPGGLGDVAKALGTHEKSDSGRIVMMQLARPRKGKDPRYTPENSPEKFEQLYVYCEGDVEAERAIDKVIPDLSASELDLYHLDQWINRRGVLVDLESVANAQYLIDKYKEQLKAKCVKITGIAPSQTGKLAEWIRANGYPQLENLQAETVKNAVEDPKCPEHIRTVLRCYSTYGAKAVSKFTTLAEMACKDGRLHGLFKFHGSATGRWASTGVQLQNLARGHIDDPDNAIIAFGARDLDWVRTLYPGVDPMKVIASTVRGMLIAPRGKTLQSLDFSAIEARVCAWLLGEQWKLDAFKSYDEGTGPDLYKVAYARLFNAGVESVTKSQRQIGKTLELACLGPETQVLTDKGYIRIVEVTQEHSVWDGLNWVKHQGLLQRGEKEVITLAGLQVTPDHLIAIRGTWLPASQLASNENILSLALETASENLPLSGLTKEKQVALQHSSLCNALVEKPLIKYTTIISARERALDAMPALKSKQDIGAKNFGITRPSFRTMNIDADCSTGYLHVSTDAAIQTTRRSTTTAAEASRYTNRGLLTEVNFFSTLCHFLGGMIRHLNLTGKMLIKDMPPEIFGSLRVKRTNKTEEKCECFKTELTNSKRKMPTFDLSCCGPNHRFTVLTSRGPLLVHNCGYEGGVGAFITMSGTLGIDLEELAEAAFDTIPADAMESAEWMWEKFGKTSGLPRQQYLVCDALKYLWRQAHPNIRQGWKDLKTAAEQAVQSPGKAFAIPTGKAMFKVVDRWLYMRLPSGRKMAYYSPRWIPERTVVEKNRFGQEVEKTIPGELRYWGIDTYTRRWMELSTYGGKLCEQLTQATSRDLLANGMLNLEHAGYHTVMTVHDEVVSEIDEDFDSFEHAGQLMCKLPAWAEGLPVAVDGHRARRYKK